MSHELELFSPDPSITRALVVVAHPDDIDFGVAGSVAALTDAGVEVAYCLVTSGDAGGDDSTHTREERAAYREAEQTAAAKVVGVEELSFLHWPDGLVEVTLELRKAIAREIRRYRPDLVITQSSERNYERVFASHPDHMAAGEATLRAVYPDARNPHAFPELLEEGFAPHTVSRVWIANPNSPTMAVDITDTFARKLTALRCHESQVGHREDLDEMMRGWASANASRAGLSEGSLVEIFRVLVTA